MLPVIGSISMCSFFIVKPYMPYYFILNHHIEREYRGLAVPAISGCNLDRPHHLAVP